MSAAFDPAQHLLDRAAELRTTRGRHVERWHHIQAELVASELERQAIVIRRRLGGAEMVGIDPERQAIVFRRRPCEARR